MTLRTALLVAVLVLTSLNPAVAKDCRNPDAPPGVRAPKPVGCDVEKRIPAKSKPAPALRASPQSGFIDLGNGAQVRIGGRVRVDAVTRH